MSKAEPENLLRSHKSTDKFELFVVDNFNDLPKIDEMNVETGAPVKRDLF
jgi:hypothetical protein